MRSYMTPAFENLDRGSDSQLLYFTVGGQIDYVDFCFSSVF